MIDRKKKICIICETPQYIFSHGRCQKCASKTYKSIEEISRLSFHKKRQPFKTMSDKLKKESAKYHKIRLDFLNENQECKAHLFGCSFWATDIHHMAGRTGKLLIDRTKFLPVCRACHSFIEGHPNFAKEKGFSLNRL